MVLCDSSPVMASAGRPAAPFKPSLKAGCFSGRADCHIQLSPRHAWQQLYPLRNLKGMEGYSGYQMFCNNSPGVGRKCACISVISKCHICLKPCLCHYQGSPLFSFFSLFFFIFYRFCHYSHYCAILHIKHCPSAY